MSKMPLRNAPLYAALAVILFCLFVLARWQQHADNLRETQAGSPSAPTVRVLMYHHLLRQAENTRYRGNDIVTHVEDFARQVAWLREQGYRSVTTAELERFLYEGGAVPEKAVMFTFDDGYLSNCVYAYPILKEAGYTAVIFPVTGRLPEREESFNPERINLLTAAQMAAHADVFEYGSHTHDLHRIAGSGSALTAAGAAAAEDLRQSLDALSDIPGGTSRVFSYPYGRFTRQTQDLLRAGGVRLAFAAASGRLTRTSDPLALPRYPVSSAVSMAQFCRYFDQPAA